MVLVNHYKSDIYGLEESGQLFLDLDFELANLLQSLLYTTECLEETMMTFLSGALLRKLNELKLTSFTNVALETTRRGAVSCRISWNSS